MKPRVRGRGASKKKLLRFLVLFVAASVLCFVLQGGTAEISVLWPGLHSPESPDNVGDLDLRTWLKLRFKGLELNNDRRIQPLVLQNIIPRAVGSLTKNDIVLATHMSTQKFDNLVAQLKHWNGPASVAIYIGSLEDVDRLVGSIDKYRQVLHQTSIHLVVEKTELPYPFNTLRKVAMESIESDYFLAMDVDFVPFPADCHTKLLTTLSRFQDKKKTLFVLPAFSVFPTKEKEYATPDMFPASKEHVVNLVKSKKMGQFRELVFPQGHRPTLYPTWLGNTNASSDTYSISLTKEASRSFEPYVLGYKPGIPRYWESKAPISCLSIGVGILFDYISHLCSRI